MEIEPDTLQTTENELKPIENNVDMEVEEAENKREEEERKPRMYPIEEDPYFPLNRMERYVRCTLCGKDVTNTLYFICAECSNTNICKQCMMSRRENETHVSTHGYRVVENLKSINLFSDDWDAGEELRLMEGMAEFRYCDWEDVAKYVATKSEKHCIDHYHNIYLKSANLLPDPTTIQHDTFIENYDEPTIPPYKGIGSDITGYNPYRDDYDVEFDNDAETMLKDVMIIGDEDDKEMEMKKCLLRLFNLRLDEREKRKQFVRERGLLDIKNILTEEKKKSKDEQEINNRMKPFSRFLTPTEYETLKTNLIKEAKLRERILQLQKYRESGVRTLEEVARLERQQETGEGSSENELLNISQYEGADKLSAEESRFCSIMHLIPAHYLAIKSTIIQECCKNGFISKDDAYKKITIDVERKEKVYDFFVSCGWITHNARVMNS